MIAVALQRAKGRDGGKNNLSGNDKSSSEIESELAEELFQKLSGEPLNRFPPQGFIE